MEYSTFQNRRVEFVPSPETYEWLDKLLKNTPSMDDMLAWAWILRRSQRWFRLDARQRTFGVDCRISG